MAGLLVITVPSLCIHDFCKQYTAMKTKGSILIDFPDTLLVKKWGAYSDKSAWSSMLLEICCARRVHKLVGQV